MNGALQSRVNEAFALKPEVDVIYTTKDGSVYYRPDSAAKHAITLKDKVITTHYRDSEVREMAQQYYQLERMVFVTDWLKRTKVMKEKPDYEVYNSYAVSMSVDPVLEEVFNFVHDRVYRIVPFPNTPGQIGQIYTYANGIVDAVFLRRYPQGQIWQYGDKLVLSCPTNTELMSGDYRDIFTPLLGVPKKEVARR